MVGGINKCVLLTFFSYLGIFTDLSSVLFLILLETLRRMQLLLIQKRVLYKSRAIEYEKVE